MRTMKLNHFIILFSLVCYTALHANPAALDLSPTKKFLHMIKNFYTILSILLPCEADVVCRNTDGITTISITAVQPPRQPGGAALLGAEPDQQEQRQEAEGRLHLGDGRHAGRRQGDHHLPVRRAGGHAGRRGRLPVPDHGLGRRDQARHARRRAADGVEVRPGARSATTPPRWPAAASTTAAPCWPATWSSRPSSTAASSR